MLSSFSGPYFLFYILTLCIYPVKTYFGEFYCYLMIYLRSVYVCKSKYLCGFSSNFNKLCLGKNLKSISMYKFEIKLQKKTKLLYPQLIWIQSRQHEDKQTWTDILGILVWWWSNCNLSAMLYFVTPVFSTTIFFLNIALTHL